MSTMETKGNRAVNVANDGILYEMWCDLDDGAICMDIWLTPMANNPVTLSGVLTVHDTS